MNERGLYLDLRRMMDDTMDRALRLGSSWTTDAVYIVDRNHRMHTVLSTLEALSYTQRRLGVGETPEQSAWSLTEQGVELYTELCRSYRRRGP